MTTTSDQETTAIMVERFRKQVSTSSLPSRRRIGWLDLSDGDSATNEPSTEESNEARLLDEQHPEPNVVTSALEGYEHRHHPVLDLDMGAVVLPSSTPGHVHLYLTNYLTTEEYQKLLDVMVEVGIVEPGFARRLKTDGFTSLRLPWVKK